MLVQTLRAAVHPLTISNSSTSIPLAWLIALMAICQTGYLLLTGQMGADGGREMADIAERLVLGFGYASPYLPLGEGEPTRVSPPLYVWVISAAYWTLGIKTEAAHTLLHLLNIIFNGLTLVMLYDVCSKWFGVRFAQIYGLAFCIQPHILLLTGGIWESTLSLMLLAIILRFMVCRFEPQQFLHWLKLGLLFGITALSNPAWTIMYPLLCLLLLGSRRLFQQPARSILCITLAIMAYGIIITPWLVRNYQISGSVSYIRNMAGPELFKGNHSDALGGHGTLFAQYWIYKSPEQQHLYRKLGEAEYDQYMRTKALTIISENPVSFAGKVFTKIAMWYSGDMDALRYWYAVGNWKKFIFGSVLSLFGMLTAALSLYGTWLISRLHAGQYPRRIWSLWVYIYFLPIPYFLIITGFRYQASLMAFILIPAIYALVQLLPKARLRR